MLPVERVSLADGSGPQSFDDRQLLFEHFEARAGRGERNSVGGVLRFVPARAEPELDAPAAHRVGLGDLDREQAGEAERDRRDQRAQSNARRLAAERGERQPRVGGPRPGRPAHVQVMVGAEEGVEAELLRQLRDRQQLVVGGALLGLGEDAEFHGCRRYPAGPDEVPDEAVVRSAVITLRACFPWSVGPS